MIRWFCMALGVLFVGLKLTEQIAWPWWQVLAPVWGLYAVGFGGLALYHAASWLERKLETPEERAARLLREMANRLGRR